MSSVRAPGDSTVAGPTLSIVVPCHNESANLTALHDRVVAACESAPVDFELILVDDGSRDDTAARIRAIAAADHRVRGVILSRNYGHQTALCAGYDHSRGAAVLVMDADLQHPPEFIPEFLAQWRAGYEVVHAARRAVKTRLGYRLYNHLCGVQIPAEAADFRLMDRKVVDALNRMPERNRFVRGMVAWLGFRQTVIPYDQADRHAGRPAYNLHKRLALRIDSVLSFSKAPLRLSIYLGLLTLLLAVIYAAYVLGLLILYGRERVVPGWPALIITNLVLGGVILICLGLLSEYVGRIYEEVKQRPLYVTSELIQHEETDA